jgi:hypothetical protein
MRDTCSENIKDLIRISEYVKSQKKKNDLSLYETANKF